MKRRILASACLLLCMAGLASAQDALKTLSAKLSESAAAFEYSFTTTGSDTPFAGSGKAIVAGPCYCIEGNGLDIRCDGKVRYTADPEAGELVIEAADGEALDFLSNPALLLSDIGKNFTVQKSSKSGGKEVYELIPVNEPSVEALTLTLVKGQPTEAALKMKDGSQANFTVTSFRFTEEPFQNTFSSAEIAKFSVVTDLR